VLQTFVIIHVKFTYLIVQPTASPSHHIAELTAIPNVSRTMQTGRANSISNQLSAWTTQIDRLSDDLVVTLDREQNVVLADRT